MSGALELIVDGYVRLDNRSALAGLKEHRETLLAQLRSQTGGCFDVSRSIGQMEEELARIEAGLAQLNGVASGTGSPVAVSSHLP